MVNIIAELIEEAEKRINIELQKVQTDIDDFNNPITSDNLKEKIDGRLSTENLTKNYEKKLDLEKQLSKITEFKFYHKDMLE